MSDVAYQVYSKNGNGAIRVVVSSAKQALAKAHELAEAGNEVLIKDLAGRILDTATIVELAARE
ncbi:hypothetical protein MTX26_27895 [Bradyrhizobium sp. ISRA443]|uniref:hypothetical protein n=1 Tax=unclassified Bradyrhizobium TaxID=2631580 RepID=UPI00247855A3|nr:MULTISPECIES: hypothetical protein [unclassified Bradyrhizobium]WGR93527.1 hypothetical protein MTX20_02760 [Bradyrhizobium sp. ISRA435]WGR98078.1 hypothetical protein MTX23_27885 [Bradyrhizobium sp. ISRA436]WGS04967.1 hypothetical protein MTX18_27890 [Bradyrhizobium sp. ISRA437]WGS11851.1 hypothetical protein MTX26_27895 [Bradyrhizobium sp. ISRA443]